MELADNSKHFGAAPINIILHTCAKKTTNEIKTKKESKSTKLNSTNSENDKSPNKRQCETKETNLGSELFSDIDMKSHEDDKD